MYDLKLVFSSCLAAGDITGVPGSIGQAADSPGAAVDRDLIGTDLAVGTVHIDIAGADRTVIAVDSDFIGAAANLNNIIQFQFVMVAAVSVSAFFDQDIVIDSFHRGMLGRQLHRFISFIVDRFQLVFGSRLAGNIVVRVPGSISQAVDRAFVIFIDSNAARCDRAVAAVDNDIAVADVDLTVTGTVHIDARADLQLVIQLHFIISAAGRIYCFRHYDITVACRNRSFLRRRLLYCIQLTAVDSISRISSYAASGYVLDLSGRTGLAYADYASHITDARPFSIIAVTGNAVDRSRNRITAQSDAAVQRNNCIVTKRNGILGADGIAVADSRTAISRNIIEKADSRSITAADIIIIAKGVGDIAADIIAVPESAGKIRRHLVIVADRAGRVAGSLITRAESVGIFFRGCIIVAQSIGLSAGYIVIVADSTGIAA